jgi:hypothetical protein
MARISWVERKFNFDFPAGLYPEMMERLRGTPARLEELIKSLPADILKNRHKDRWSIQENTGHLGDTEALWTGRMDDYIAGLSTLRAADMSNKRTYNADHNADTIDNLLKRFRSLRGELMSRLDKSGPDDFARSAMHPRLMKPMRMVDMCLFIAEHDDFHLASIRELAGILSKQ